MKLWAMLCRATQDGRDMVKSSDKMWSTGEGNGKPLQYSCLANPINSTKGKTISYQKKSILVPTLVLALWLRANHLIIVTVSLSKYKDHIICFTWSSWGTNTMIYVKTLCVNSLKGFPDTSAGKESPCNGGDTNLISGSGTCPGEGRGYPLQYSWASLVAQLINNLPAMRETWVWSLNWEDPLEKGKATYSSILAWRIPWTL